MHHRRRTLDGRSTQRLFLVPALGLALALGAAPAQAAPGKAHCSVKKSGGRSADYRPAGVGGGRRIR